MKSDRELKTDLTKSEFELLIPAGNKNSALKAINFGADAIYIAYSKFGARAAAGNSFEDLAETVFQAHKFGVKVYVTVNTILTDDELSLVEKLIKKLKLIKIDALIIMDFGILMLDLPPIRLHASTQCHNNTSEKIKFLEKSGFKRVILPREITIEEIKEIRKNNDIELECFIHGALCVSYSGQCYLSRVIGGRSANRGECAQPCRNVYTVTDMNGTVLVENKHILSLKDFNLSSRLEELILSGVTSFKVEGRLKNEAYVINTTAFYRQKLDEILEKYSLKRASEGNCIYDFTPDLKKTFNRGFCEFNIDGKKKKIATLNYASAPGEYAGTVKSVKNNFFTLTKNFNFNNGDGIGFYDKNDILSGTNINKCENGKIFPADMKNITVGMRIYRNYDKGFDDKLKNSKTERKINIEIRVKETDIGILFIAQDKKDNAAVYLLPKNYEYARNKASALKAMKTQLLKSGSTEFNVADCRLDVDNIPFLKVSELNEIRRNLLSKLQQIRIKNYKQPEYSPKPEPAEYPVKELDFKANIHNDKAEEFFVQRGCKVKERSLESQTNMSNREVMISKYCIKNELGLCPKIADAKIYEKYGTNKDALKKLYLKDKFNKKYLVEFACCECVMKVKTF